MDIIDQAERHEQQSRDIAIRNAQAAKIDTSNPSGYCWTCDEPTGNDRRWCSRECCDIWSKRN